MVPKIPQIGTHDPQRAPSSTIGFPEHHLFSRVLLVFSSTTNFLEYYRLFRISPILSSIICLSEQHLFSRVLSVFLSITILLSTIGFPEHHQFSRIIFVCRSSIYSPEYYRLSRATSVLPNTIGFLEHHLFAWALVVLPNPIYSPKSSFLDT